jgi:hypothetical protein
MTTASKLFRSAHGYISPYFVVDVEGNLITKTLTITGRRLELTSGSSLSYNGVDLLSPTTLGSSVVNILGTLTGLTVAGTVSLAGTGTVSVTPSGTVTIAPTVTGNIDNVNIGATTPRTGKFTALQTINDVVFDGTGNISFPTAGSVTIAPLGILSIGTAGQSNNMAGNITAITTDQLINFSPLGTGTITINPETTGTLDNVTIGNTTAQAGKFTNVTLNSSDEQWGSNRSQAVTKRYSENSTMIAYFTGS